MGVNTTVDCPYVYYRNALLYMTQLDNSTVSLCCIKDIKMFHCFLSLNDVNKHV